MGASVRTSLIRRNATTLAGAIALAIAATGCGSNSGGSSGTTVATASPPSSKAVRAAALSLQAAMDGSARAIDGVRGTKASLEDLGASLKPTAAQTGDVIVLLTPLASDAEQPAAAALLSAARQQRSFLQFAADAADSRTASAGNRAIQRARGAGLRASTAYQRIAQNEQFALTGLLPTAATFNTGRLRDAVRNSHKVKGGTKPHSPPPPPGNSPPPPPPAAPAGGSCGGGISVNGVTSCAFAANVRDEFRSSGGSSVIQVFSPVTQQSYTMYCSGGAPTTCRGGNGAVVTFS